MQTLVHILCNITVATGSNKTIKNLQKLAVHCKEKEIQSIPNDNTSLNSWVDSITDNVFKTKTKFYQGAMKHYNLRVGEWWPRRGRFGITGSEVVARKVIMQSRYGIVKDHMRSLTQRN